GGGERARAHRRVLGGVERAARTAHHLLELAEEPRGLLSTIGQVERERDARTGKAEQPGRGHVGERLEDGEERSLGGEPHATEQFADVLARGDDALELEEAALAVDPVP